MGAVFLFRSLVLRFLVLSFAIDAPLVLSLTCIDVPQLDLIGSELVKIRIEGQKSTIFEGTVQTRGHPVTTASSNGIHMCDGPNHKIMNTPSATATTALDDASRAFFGGFTWDATYSFGDDDFAITGIAGDSQTPKATQDGFLNWGLFVNYDFIQPGVKTSQGGCQKRVKTGDEVLWAYDALLQIYFLKLSGPAAATVNVPFELTVTDGVTKKPLAGAVVEGKMTDTNGKVMITVSSTGVRKFEAKRVDSIRSNSIGVFVVPKLFTFPGLP